MTRTTVGRVLAGALVLAIAVVGLWRLGPAEPAAVPSLEPSPSSVPAPTTAPSPSPVVAALELDLERVTGSGVEGKPPGERLREAAEAVRVAMTEVYATAFVDPEAWHGGDFPGLARWFLPGARERASRDLEALTLGSAARRLESVRPRIARLRVRVVTDERNRPVLAFASVRFKGIGVADGVHLPIGHDGAYVLRRTDAGWRIAGYDVAGRVPSATEVDQVVEEARLAPPVPSIDPMFVLVIGSDARPGTDPARGLADSLHIVGVNPREGVASVLGIPRDTFVPIPGHGTNKINASLALGGPDLVVQTVERLSGVRIDAYVLTGFAGFDRIVSAVGPIGIQIPYAMDDPYSHARFRAGRTELSAREALAFSRNRHDAPGGDFGRSLNQGRLLVAALAELRSDLRGGQVRLLPWLLAGARHLETDLDLGQMADLLLSVPAIDPDRVRNRVVPGRTGTSGGRSIVLLSPGADAMFRDLARDAMLGR
jgi:LCP family protein required for cell wall assembly